MSGWFYLPLRPGPTTMKRFKIGKTICRNASSSQDPYIQTRNGPVFFLETLVALFIVSLGEYLEVAVGQMQFRILVPSFNFQTWRRSSKTDFGTPILNAMGWVSQLMWLKGLKLCYQHPDLWLISLESFSPET